MIRFDKNECKFVITDEQVIVSQAIIEDRTALIWIIGASILQHWEEEYKNTQDLGDFFDTFPVNDGESMGTFGAMGFWKVDSKEDPRWNKSGRGFGVATVGGPKEMQNWIQECIEKYGDPPNDAIRQFWKD